ncbi:MAG: 16S rRNA (guanine(527)-N(7))-methyltransferase RsmG [Clostridiales bacterium]|nr:16S rRNA (guanine(527)-N(7))-methyltransferase RsmG [Clostridiales bacterium]MBQ3107753.1 16S rRNA (guanine(527)-N(7))-methyltransferase RsmG [Bacillota bacterium]
MQQLAKALDAMGVPYTEKTLEQFREYRRLVLEWNEKVNLTAIKDPEEFERKHFVDSVMAAQHPAFRKAQKIIDVGTGGGFPGVPLAILFPEKEFVLMDSLAKRIRIVEEMTAAIGLTNVKGVHGRAEDLGHAPEHREAYDLCCSRAVAALPVLAEYCLPFVKVGGWFAPYKTGASRQEVEESRKALAILGGRFKEETGPAIELTEDHRIFWIAKESKTGSKYPRKAGTPAKNPLK